MLEQSPFLQQGGLEKYYFLHNSERVANTDLTTSGFGIL